MKEVIQQYAVARTKKFDDSKPLVTTWKDARMIRYHALRSVALAIIIANKGLDVVKINLIGSPSTGKTTLAKALAHLIHEIAYEINKTPYVVKVFTRKELLNMEETLSKLPPVNHIMIFDDVSWLVAGNNKAKIDQVQKTFTEIRHLPGGEDIKVIIIFNFHYNLSIPKHLRQAHFFGYTDLGSSELENTQKLVGAANTPRLIEFRKVVHEAHNTYRPALDDEPEVPATFSYKVGKNKKFTYPFRNPFAPALWWDNDKLKHIVFPTREWIDPVCPICSGGKTLNKEEEIIHDVEQFKQLADGTYNESKIRTALRVILLKRGINCFSPEIKRAVHWLEKEFALKSYDQEALMAAYGLDATETFSTRKAISKAVEAAAKEKKDDDE